MISIISLIFITTTSIIHADLYDKWYEEFDYNTYMGGSNEEFQVFWNEDQEACTLEVGLAVQTDGWVGFGISENGVGMQQSDIVMGWIDSQGDLVIENGYATWNQRPTPFEDQSYVTPIEGMKTEINGTMTTFVRFKRELFPEFDDNARSVKIGTTRVIWARGPLSPADTPIGHTDSPSDRFHESMNLLQGESSPIPMPNDTLSVDVFMANISLPDDETTYYCSIIEMPSR